MISQTLIRILETCKDGGGNKVRNDGGAMMVVIFTNTEIGYLVISLFNVLVRSLLF